MNPWIILTANSPHASGAFSVNQPPASSGGHLPSSYSSSSPLLRIIMVSPQGHPSPLPHPLPALMLTLGKIHSGRAMFIIMACVWMSTVWMDQQANQKLRQDQIGIETSGSLSACEGQWRKLPCH